MKVLVLEESDRQRAEKPGNGAKRQSPPASAGSEERNKTLFRCAEASAPANVPSVTINALSIDQLSWWSIGSVHIPGIRISIARCALPAGFRVWP